jgi:conjugal transfer ATP-binding protein TraC
MKKNNRLFREFNEYQAEHSLARELPYWEFHNDLVALSDGSLCLGLKLSGISIETWNAERINRLTQDLRALLNGLPDSLELTFAVDMNSDYESLIADHEGLKGENANVSWIAEARINGLKSQMNNKQLMRPTLYLFMYHRLGVDGGKKASFLSSFFRAPKYFQAVRREQHERMEKELRQTVASTEGFLGTMGIEAKPLTQRDSLALIYRFLNPKRSQAISTPVMQVAHLAQEFSHEELKVLPELAFPSPREQLVFSEVIQGYETFFFDGYYHRTLTLKTLPEETHAAMVSKFMQLPFHFWLDVHVKVPEQAKELSDLQSKRRMAHSMSASQGGRATDLESEAQLSSTEDLLRELIGTGQKIFYFQAALLLRANSQDELDMMTKAALQKFRELAGAEGLAETVAGFKVYKTLLPLGNVASVRPKRVKTDNLADFIPIYEPYQGKGKPVCLFHNRFSGLVSYDPFDSNLPNYNALVTGSSGAGKSFLNNLILLQFMTQKPIIFVIDIGGSYKKLCEFMNGQYIEIGPAKEGEERKAINPFELESGETEPSSQKIKFLVALLESMFTDSDAEKLPKLSKSLLEEAVIQTYKHSFAQEQRVPRLSDLRKILEASPEVELQNFAKMLFPWTGARAYGQLLDRANELDLTSDFVVFDLKGLSSYPDLQAVMILIITDFIVGKVESKNPAYFGRRKRIYMDECWENLKSRPASHVMEYWVRTLRKAAAGITFITQGLEEIAAHAIGPAILGNTATKLILMQKGDLEPVRQILKLNDQEMSLISSLRQQKGLYSEAFMIANDDRTVIRAYPTPLEYWLATSDRDDNSAVEEYRLAHPSDSISEIIYELASQYPKGIAFGKVGKT